jgi:uroporphyrin-III C-methyltransferase/precorrin-2 dehydrogenase/sirohydrochlorin ferrochelatase
MKPFPLFLQLANRRVILVGGGRVAASKLDLLLEAGARVTVVAPHIRAELERPGVELVRRPFRPTDLIGCWFVVSAATPEVGREVADAAAQRCIFVNAADDPDAASAYLGSVVRRSGVTLAISTNGCAPALAALLREAVESLLPLDLGEWMATARRIRARWHEEGVPMAARRPLLLRALNELYGVTA